MYLRETNSIIISPPSKKARQFKTNKKTKRPKQDSQNRRMSLLLCLREENLSFNQNYII